jgi:replicative DNA helicase
MRAEKASRSSNQDEKYTEICNGIQQLAKDTHIPFVVLSQLNREFEKASGKNKRPTLSQCRGSGSIEQITNVGICLFREEMYNKDREELRGLAEFIVEKNRDGEAKTLKMRFKGWLCRFEDWD